MNLQETIRTHVRALKQRWGTATIKKALWNKEFEEGRWESLENTTGDCVYPYVEKYCRNGSILDLGCGSGNTGNELEITTYKNYMGVDISDVATRQAITRSERNGRGEKNQYTPSDIVTYTPTQKYDVILFRESVCYIPRHKIRMTLDRYSHYLKAGGVFIVRLWSREQNGQIVDMIEQNYSLLDRYQPDTSPTIILVFQRHSSSTVPLG